MRDSEDAYGRAMLDFFRGRGGDEVVEREDGVVTVSPGPSLYLSPFEEWVRPERQAMRHVRGRVLDVGCGAGRALLYLQSLGFDVVGIDSSPGAVEVCRLRGAKDVRLLSLGGVSSRLGEFDTVLLLGGNFGLLGDRERATRLLRRLHRITNARSRLLAASRDPRLDVREEDVEYRRSNVRRGRMPGQQRLRVRYRGFATPWLDFLRVSQREMQSVLTGSGWRVDRFLGSNRSVFVGVITKE